MKICKYFFITGILLLLSGCVAMMSEKAQEYYNAKYIREYTAEKKVPTSTEYSAFLIARNGQGIKIEVKKAEKGVIKSQLRAVWTNGTYYRTSTPEGKGFTTHDYWQKVKGRPSEYWKDTNKRYTDSSSPIGSESIVVRDSIFDEVPTQWLRTSSDGTAFIKIPKSFNGNILEIEINGAFTTIELN